MEMGISPRGIPPRPANRVRPVAAATCVGLQASSVVAMMVFSPSPWVFGAVTFGIAGFILCRGDGPEREAIRGEDRPPWNDRD